MSVATRPPAGAANRLPRSGSAGNRAREIQLGLLGVLGLAVLVAGIPAALVLFVGYPLPRTGPSHDWLTQSISATLIIKVLACVVWVVWAHFAVCLLAEWRAIRRGRLPGRVALGGGSQLLARRLVAAALLLAGAATAVPHSSGSAPAPAAAISVHHSVAATPARPAAAAPDHAPSAAQSQSAAPAAAAKYYTVAPPNGRRYDSLWDIADRTLHDPLRYKEIFALNKDRVQADGSKLIDANLIQPGWELRLPSDASGPGVHVAHAARPAAPTRVAPATPGPGATASPGRQSVPVANPVGGAASTSAAGGVAGPGFSSVVAAPSPEDASSTSLVFGGALMLAGVLMALSARRGPYGVQTEEDAALGLAADPSLAALLGRALRNLAAARAAQGRPLPHPVVAWVSSERITLNLAGGDAADPPAPWVRDDQAHSWTCDSEQAAEAPAADVAAPFPGLLSVGTDEGYELFVDFEQAPGPISIGGDLEAGRELAAALAVQAATSLWSDGARVTVVGFGDGDELARIDPRAIVSAPHLGDVLDDLEHDHQAVLRLQRQLGVDGVLTGRQLRRSGVWQPHVIVLSGPPAPDDVLRLQALATGRSNFVVLVVGDIAGARWRFVVDPAGRVDLGVLGASAQAHRLTRAAVAQLAELLAQASRDKAAETGAVAALTPHRAVAEIDAPTRPSPPAGGEVRATVSLLGPVTVTVGGPIDPAKLALVTEIVVAVALHPDGLHDAVLRASIWPRGASDAVCGAAMAEAVAWLGANAASRPCLAQSEGRWHLSDAVRVDWDELRRLADTVPGPAELDSLIAAIGLFQDEAFSATPSGRYGWLTFARAARDAKVVGTAAVRRAAALLADQQRTDQAEDVLRRGLRLVPDAELLWRDLLVITGQRSRQHAAAVAEQMYATLRARHAWPEPETDALVAQLAPEHDADRSA